MDSALRMPGDHCMWCVEPSDVPCRLGCRKPAMPDAGAPAGDTARVSEGLLLILRDERRNLPTGYQWWVVKSVRALKNGDARVTLLNGSETMSATATATFPGGTVADPWRVVKLNQKDWQKVWEARPNGR